MEIKGRILLAENNKVNQLLISELLLQRGFSVTVANNGVEALAYLNHSDWEAILVDLHMPELDGFATAREIRRSKDYKQLPIIALTVNTMKEDQKQCMITGINAIVVKPVDELKLMEALEQWIRYKCLLLLDGVDTEKAIHQMDDKAHVLQYALIKFKEVYQNFTHNVDDELSRDNVTTVDRMLHSLKGIAINLYAAPLLTAVSALELAFVHRVSNTNWRDRLTDVQVEIDRITKSISWE